MLVAVTLIGILGVVKQSSTTNSLLVFFSVIFSACDLKGPSVRADNSRRSTMLGIDRMGFRR